MRDGIGTPLSWLGLRRNVGTLRMSFAWPGSGPSARLGRWVHWRRLAGPVHPPLFSLLESRTRWIDPMTGWPGGLRDWLLPDRGESLLPKASRLRARVTWPGLLRSRGRYGRGVRLIMDRTWLPRGRLPFPFQLRALLRYLGFEVPRCPSRILYLYTSLYISAYASSVS